MLRWMPKWVRENLSPKAVWIVLAAAFTSGSWIARENGRDMALQHETADTRAIAVAQVQATKELTVTVNQINMNLAEVKTRLEDIGKQVDSQQAKWERVESAAEIRVPRRKK